MQKKKPASKKRAQRKQAPLPPGLQVSERVQLQDVKLWRCACEQREEATRNQKKQYKLTHSATVEVDKSNGCICVSPSFHFEAFNEGEDLAIVSVDATFLLMYGITSCDGLGPHAYQQFADMNGVYNAWPYWRELIQTTIARMGLPTLVLPVFRIAEPVKSRPKKTRQPAARR